MPLRNVIFDMDGVIIDSHPVHRQAWRSLFQSLGRMVNEQELEFVVDGHKRDEILRFFLGELTAAELLTYGSQKDMMFSQCAAEMQLVEGARDFIFAWKASGVRLAVASSARRSRVEETLARFGLQENFAVIASGDDVSCGKPDPALFSMACQRLGGDANSTLVIEDAVSGVIAARSADMQCMGIGAGNRAMLLYEAGAKYVVPNFAGVDVEAVSRLFDNWPPYLLESPVPGITLR